MPIRRPEAGHEALFMAHRRTRHLSAFEQPEARTAEVPSPALPADDDVPAPDAPQTASAALARSADAGPRMRADADVTTTERPPPRRRRLVSANTAAAASSEMMTIKMVVPYPARGTSPALDALAAEIGEDAAVRSLLRRAFDDFRSALEAGEMPESLPVYEEVETTVATTRSISKRAHETAARNLDPARLLSNRAFARLLARRALAHFFETERRTTAT